MKTIERKALSYIDRIFKEILNIHQNEPWPQFKEALAQIYLAGAKAALAWQWRSVEDELPKAEQDVLVAIATQTNHQFAFAWLSTLSNGTLRWYSYDDTFPLDKIRYWMPIPLLPPKDDTE